MIDELKKIQLEQKKFKNTFWFVVGILILLAGTFLLFRGFISSNENFILFGIIAFVFGSLLAVLNKIGLNKLKEQAI
ncbi:MAG TPA: hypothetical protein PK357_00065 [Candidatus Pacearchaeota archaeon]|nr:hypothetical protein [Candidatus Pacearchaeota archaeon]